MLEHLNLKKPLLMGVLNITPDSFSDGGKYFQTENAIKHAKKLTDQGVDIIDVGGESTRPDAKPVSEEEELRRVIPVVEVLEKIKRQRSREAKKQRKQNSFLISIDTYKSNVAQLALNAGADIINDVSGLTMDPNMVQTARDANCQIVIMHNKGIPATKPISIEDRSGMSATCPSSKNESNIVQEVYHWLQKQTQYAINNGIKKENIIIDPGLGFGKTSEEDLYLIKNLDRFKPLGFPILIGPSRKSFIKKLFPNDDLETKSKELIKLAVSNGADIVRVH